MVLVIMIIKYTKKEFKMGVNDKIDELTDEIKLIDNKIIEIVKI